MTGRILVVDDEPLIRRLLQLYFEAEGYEVFVAGDGEEGLARAREIGPDLIVMDIMMPRLDGIAATGVLRADAETRDIPIMLLTAKGGSLDNEIGLKAGADAYVTKQAEPAEVLERARELLEGGRA